MPKKKAGKNKDDNSRSNITIFADSGVRARGFGQRYLDRLAFDLLRINKLSGLYKDINNQIYKTLSGVAGNRDRLATLAQIVYEATVLSTSGIEFEHEAGQALMWAARNQMIPNPGLDMTKPLMKKELREWKRWLRFQGYNLKTFRKNKK
ncbi:MAG TPA: hypothetical protein P5056_00905 [Candidatus Paceibacterota bacterium]|nr:hypothetical protein [Candidatus Paceibacterota bacterium]